MHLYAHSHQHSWHLSLLGLNALGGAAPTLFSFVSLSVGSGTKGHTGCCSEKKWNLRPPSRDHQDCEWRWLPFIIDIYIWVCANVDVVEREREREGGAVRTEVFADHLRLIACKCFSYHQICVLLSVFLPSPAIWISLSHDYLHDAPLKLLTTVHD